MSDPSRDVGTARLVELVVADPPGAWGAAGFAVVDGVVTVGSTEIRPIGGTESTGKGREATGIIRWAVSGLDLPEGSPTLDGLTTEVVPPDGPGLRQRLDHGDRAHPTHPNGATKIDHVVVFTPDLGRSVAAFEAAGMTCRRVRQAGTAVAPVRQAFFRMGPTIVEVVGGPDEQTSRSGGSGGMSSRVPEATEAPATWFGIAVDVSDIDATAALLGDGLGPVKAAVQPGRRIATLRHRRLGLSVATAVMDDHGDR